MRKVTLFLFSLPLKRCLLVPAGPTSQKYQEVFLSRLLSCVGSSQPEVRQAAAYGCGVLGQFGGPGYAQGGAAFSVISKPGLSWLCHRAFLSVTWAFLSLPVHLGV
jgi:hypothetical protein